MDAETTAEYKWVGSLVATLIAMLTLQMASLGFAPLLPAMQSEFHMDYSMLGLFTGMYGLMALVLSLPAGAAAKAVGEKKVLMAGLAVVIFGLVILSQSRTSTAAFAGRAVWLFGYRFAFVSVLTAIAVTCPPHLKNRSMGLLGASSAVASLIGAPYAANIGQRFGWRGGILAFAATALIGLLAIVIFYRPRNAAQAGRAALLPANLHGIAGGSQNAFRNPLVWGVAVLVGFSGFGQFCANFFIPGAIHSIYKLDQVAISIILGTGYACGIVANLIFGYFMDRYNKWIILTVMFSIMIPAAMAMTIENLLIFRIASATLLAVGLAAVNQVYGVAGGLLRGSEAGNVMGVVSLGAGVFGYIGPQSVGWLRQITGGFSAGWYEIAVVCFIAALLSLFLMLANRRLVASSLQRTLKAEVTL